MAEPRPLDRLAALAGIESDYTDEWGNPRTAPDATKVALLCAMGFPADTPDAVEGSLHRLEAAPWQRVLPPVLVWRRRRGRTPEIPVVLPSGRGERTLLWSLEEESGRAVQGSTRLDDLPITGRGERAGERVERRVLSLPQAPPLGYQRVRLFIGEDSHETVLIVVPARCHMPSGLLRDGRTWGLAIQLYALRSEHNWGMGDLGDLRRFTAVAAELGAGAIGLNPLHALFLSNPAHASPYSPSSRVLLNALYIDVAAADDLAECEAARRRLADGAFQARLRSLRETELVDYPGVAEAKMEILELLYASFRARHLGGGVPGAESERGARFRRFQAAEGEALERLCVFEALAEHLAVPGGWRTWPEPYRDPASPEVAAFVDAHRERVEFFQYLQWVADLQLHDVVDETTSRDMAIGLYHDLALAVDGNGAEAWGQQDLYAAGMSIGAPPDAWNYRGQNWGMPPVNPWALRERAYAPFASVLSANMRHGAALRIDHVMSLQRLFWIPDGAEPVEGAYVRQPFDDLLGLLALESQRQRSVVIGEDLGTVPTGFRERMRAANVLSYRLLYFQRAADGELLAPQAYPRLSTIVVATHDLAPLPGYWAGRDLDVRAELGLYPSRDMEERARAEREDFRVRMIEALEREGLLPAEAAAHPAGLSDDLVLAIYTYLARAAGRLLMVHPEDILGVTEQLNVPGTTHEHPNWRRKLPLDIEHFGADPRVRRLAAALSAIRPPIVRRRRRTARHGPR